ncbi:MAG: hypothetical protein UC755_04055, partial [Oscillospiraceae bacterium]|nr:hypothetical protein [Oscillospiraceae bacterium]
LSFWCRSSSPWARTLRPRATSASRNNRISYPAKRPNHAVGTLFVIFRNLTEKNVSIFESKMQQKLQNPLSCGKRAVIIRIECNASLRDLHIFYGEIA